MCERLTDCQLTRETLQTQLGVTLSVLKQAVQSHVPALTMRRPSFGSPRVL